jgi:hypothetical protein
MYVGDVLFACVALEQICFYMVSICSSHYLPVKCCLVVYLYILRPYWLKQKQCVRLLAD